MHEQHSPLIRLAKRDAMPRGQVWAIRGASFVAAFLISALIFLLMGHSPVEAYGTMISGSLGKPTAIRQTVRIAVPLLGTALAIAPCFKMRFWNIGAEGQITAGAVGASYFALFWADKLPQVPLLIVMAVAGAICGEAGPARPLGGAVLRGIPALAARYGESDVDALLQGGVTPVELVGGVCSVIRGVTTRTKTGGAADPTWRELTTILVVDDVVPGVREALRAKFARAKNTAQTREAVRSQVILELEGKVAAEVIAGYGEVTAQALAEDPTVCLVTFSFTVAQGLNQIWLSAQITV